MNGCFFQQFLRQTLTWFLFRHRKTLFLRSLIFKPTERGSVLLKNSKRDFQNSPPFESSTCLYVKINGNSEFFQYFNFYTNFLKKENIFQRTRVPLFSWNTTSPYETALSAASRRTNKMGSTKWTYRKNLLLL